MTVAIAGVASFAIGQQGWQEKYIFKGSITTPLQALPLLQQIVWGRTAFFGEGATCIFARASSTNNRHDGNACDLPYPIGPHPSWQGGTGPGNVIGPINDPTTSIQQRFETNVGNFWQRYFRCIPDDWVTGKMLSTGILPFLKPLAAGQALGDMSPVGGLSHLQVCQTFWSYLIQNTAYAQRVSAGNYTLGDFQFIQFRQVTSRKIGSPFGRSRGRRQKSLFS